MEKTLPKIKFAETLVRLLQIRGAIETRKKICAALDVTQATLTQWLRGNATPRLSTLVDLASLLQVDLAYLVFGESPKPTVVSEGSHLLQTVDRGVASLHRKFDTHQAVLGRLTSLLHEELVHATKKIVDEYSVAAGLIHDDELAVLEEFSEETVLVRLRLEIEDQEQRDDFPSDARSPGGRFLPVIARNLAQGRKYHYILADRATSAQAQRVRHFLSTLRGMGVPDGCLANCVLGTTTAPIVGGCCLYGLNHVRLSDERPDLAARLEPVFVRRKNLSWFGCTLPPSIALKANPQMDQAHVNYSLRMVRDIQANHFRRLA